MKTFDQLQRDIGQWQRDTFRNQSVFSKIKHLQREVIELEQKPTDRSELADCLILILAIAETTGVSNGTLLQAACEKMEINKLRKWGRPDADGVQSHI